MLNLFPAVWRCQINEQIHTSFFKLDVQEIFFSTDTLQSLSPWILVRIRPMTALKSNFLQTSGFRYFLKLSLAKWILWESLCRYLARNSPLVTFSISRFNWVNQNTFMYNGEKESILKCNPLSILYTCFNGRRKYKRVVPIFLLWHVTYSMTWTFTLQIYFCLGESQYFCCS